MITWNEYKSNVDTHLVFLLLCLHIVGPVDLEGAHLAVIFCIQFWVVAVRTNSQSQQYQNGEGKENRHLTFSRWGTGRRHGRSSKWLSAGPRQPSILGAKKMGQLKQKRHDKDHNEGATLPGDDSQVK